MINYITLTLLAPNLNNGSIRYSLSDLNENPAIINTIKTQVYEAMTEYYAEIRAEVPQYIMATIKTYLDSNVIIQALKGDSKAHGTELVVSFFTDLSGNLSVVAQID